MKTLFVLAFAITACGPANPGAPVDAGSPDCIARTPEGADCADTDDCPSNGCEVWRCERKRCVLVQIYNGIPCNVPDAAGQCHNGVCCAGFLGGVL